MSQSTFIKAAPHFALVIRFRDFITFEALLQENEIDYYTEELPLLPSSGIKYFFRDEDRKKLDEVLKLHKFEAGTTTTGIADYSIGRKSYKFYLFIFLMLGVIFLIIQAIN